MPSSPHKSYTSLGGAPRGRLQAWRLLIQRTRQQSADIDAHVAKVLDVARRGEAEIAEALGRPVENLDALEIGVGQLPRQIAWFARHNRVTGIDLDVVESAGLRAFIHVWRRNGPIRAIKTAARQMLGFDRKFVRELRRQMSLDRLPDYRLKAMDATRLDFADESFDLVYSFDVFEHLDDPEAVLREAMRVLRPGGVCMTWLHPFTAEDGNHDNRVLAGLRDDVPLWAHLRPSCQHLTQADAFVNGWRLARWLEAFERLMPGVRLTMVEHPSPSLPGELRQLREDGELGDYTDEELLTHRLVATWRKPGG